MDINEVKLNQMVAFVGIVKEIAEDGVVCVVAESCPDSRIYRLFNACFLSPFGAPESPSLAEDREVPSPVSLTRAIKDYRNKFRDAMNGWDWANPREIAEALHEEVDELSCCLDPVISGQDIDSRMLAAELADVIIVAMDYLRRQAKSQEDAMSLEQIIQGRIDSNLDRAERAREAAALKNSEPKEEWATTKRLFEL